MCIHVQPNKSDYSRPPSVHSADCYPARRHPNTDCFIPTSIDSQTQRHYALYMLKYLFARHFSSSRPHPVLWERVHHSLSANEMSQAMGVQLRRVEPGCVEVVLPYSKITTNQVFNSMDSSTTRYVMGDRC